MSSCGCESTVLRIPEVELPPPLDETFRELAASGHSNTAAHPDSNWFLPGYATGRHINPAQLRERLLTLKLPASSDYRSSNIRRYPVDSVPAQREYPARCRWRGAGRGANWSQMVWAEWPDQVEPRTLGASSWSVWQQPSDS